MYIKEELYKCDVSKNVEYQTRFNAFYKVRRNKKWRNDFYNYFEKIKYNKNICFDEILDYVYNKTGYIEASFCSKLLSTINDDMPIWDQYILKNLHLNVDGNSKSERLNNTKKKYHEIVRKEREMLKNKNIQESIKNFRKNFSEFKLSDIKILDYILWNIH